METNLEKIKQVAKSFLYLDYQEVEGLSPLLFVHHPFITSLVVYSPKSNACINLQDEEALDYYRKEIMEPYIDKSDLTGIFFLLNKTYYLAFIKYIMPYLSERDMAEVLAHAWVAVENPNQDVNCSIESLTKMFKNCNKQYLMTAEDYEVYKNLPEQFTVYRGVAVGRAHDGLSWTQNKEQAIWFANRFNTKDEKGYLLAATINKSDVLAYFNTRNEEEIVVNVNSEKYKKERIELD